MSDPNTPKLGRNDSPTILLVDDDTSIRGLISEALKIYGYHLLLADSGEHALEVWSNYGKPIDLLLTDVFMPHMNGPDLAEALGALQPGLKVVFISGSDREAVDALFAHPEEIRLLKKPALVEHLRECVRQAIEGD